ncbi:MAG: hypothetical protein LBQ12_02405 [Deltaproteobacteria bacterium]|nr:hypothetical protein [Deltaproteobacteria bacterium]
MAKDGPCSADKTLKISESLFIGSVGEYRPYKTTIELAELLGKVAPTYARMLGNGKSLEFIVADANYALKKNCPNTRVTVTGEDMTASLGGEKAVRDIISAGVARRGASKARRSGAKAAKATEPGEAVSKEKGARLREPGDRAVDRGGQSPATATPAAVTLGRLRPDPAAVPVKPAG